ncbi:MAG: hypothetical protein IIT58_08950 [Treponema sp.]|nr:hypothetical protein [Treponema sp.]
MTGFYLNLILTVFGCLALTSGINFSIHEKDSGHIRVHTLLFSISTFLACIGFSLMSFTPDPRYAFIPRIIGILGIDVYMLLELDFLFVELKVKKTIRISADCFFGMFLFFVLIIFGRPSSVHFIRYDYHTSFEILSHTDHLFQNSYLACVDVTLLVFAIKWLQSIKIQREKIFALQIMSVNFIFLFSAIPDILNLTFSKRYPTMPYCTGILLVYFFYWISVKHHILFTPTVKHVSEEIFYSVDVPVLIFNMEGSLILFNPRAQEVFKIDDETDQNLRSLFTFSDVDTLRFLAKAKTGKKGRKDTKIKISEKPCVLSYSINFNDAEEPFCIICTVLLSVISNNRESK